MVFKESPREEHSEQTKLSKTLSIISSAVIKFRDVIINSITGEEDILDEETFCILLEQEDFLAIINNMNRFSLRPIEIVDKLIDQGHSDVVIKYLESFVFYTKNTIENATLNVGKSRGYFYKMDILDVVVKSCNKKDVEDFSLEAIIASKLIKAGYESEVFDNLEKFNLSEKDFTSIVAT